MPFEIKLVFRCRYSVQHGGDLPGAGVQQFHYPPDPVANPGGVAIVHVFPEVGTPWVGVFSGGSNGGCFSCPDGKSLAVVAGGCGYIVRADKPDVWERVKAFPVVDIIAAEQAGLLLMVDYTGIVAYGSDGLRWSSLDVSSDGVRILNVSDRLIEGVGWAGQDYRIVLDVKTGQTIEGGPKAQQKTSS